MYFYFSDLRFRKDASRMESHPSKNRSRRGTSREGREKGGEKASLPERRIGRGNRYAPVLGGGPEEGDRSPLLPGKQLQAFAGAAACLN